MFLGPAALWVLAIGLILALALMFGWLLARRTERPSPKSLTQWAAAPSRLRTEGHRTGIHADAGADDWEEADDGARSGRKLLAREERSRRAMAVIERIETARGSRVVAIIHRETLESDYLAMNDLEDVLTALAATPPGAPLDIVLHTRGGLSLAAMQISRAIKAHKGKKTAFVPYYAMSAGTMIALACDEIVMTPHACLGPIDPQLGVPAVSILKASRAKPVEFVNDDTLIFADISEKALAESKAHACELMQGTYSHDGSCFITDQLSSGKWTHGNPITVGAAKELGLKVSTAMPPEMIELVRTHRVPRRGGPSVAFRG
jgi:ClpP class serine protease